jgi:hypothetical protein
MLRGASWLETLRRRIAYFAARARHHAGVAREMRGGRVAYLWRQARVAGRGLAPRTSSRERRSRERRDSWVGTLMAWTPERYAGAMRLVETDEGARRGFGAAWRSICAASELVRVPGGHTGLILDHGEEVAAALRRWLAGPRAADDGEEKRES